MKWTAPGLLVLLAALVLSACGDDSQAASEANTLTIAMGPEPGTLNLLEDSQAQAEIFSYNVYETLSRIDVEGEPQPLLAESWTTEGTTFTVKLREGIRFHDGSELDSADVVATYSRAIRDKNTAAVGMVSVSAVDGLTAAIETEGPNPEMPRLVSRLPIFPSEVADGSEMNDKMIGTGPYEFTRWTRNDSLEMKRYDDYWGDEAEFDTVVWRFRPETAVRVSMLRAGEVDAAMDISAGDVANLEHVVSGPSSNIIIMRPKYYRGSPLADDRLRRAVSLAIDNESIISGIYGGRAEDPRGQVVIPRVLGFDEELTDPEYDPDEASRLVAEAAPNGATLTLAVDGSWDKAQEVAEAIGAQLEAVGFTVNASFDDTATLREKLFVARGGDFSNIAAMPDLVFTRTGNVTFTAFGNLYSHTCTGSFPGGCDQKFTDLVQSAEEELDLEARAAIYREAMAMLRDEVLAIPIVSLNRIVALREGVEWTVRPGTPVLVSNISKP